MKKAVLDEHVLLYSGSTEAVDPRTYDGDNHKLESFVDLKTTAEEYEERKFNK